jgi:hypothetical protein
MRKVLHWLVRLYPQAWRERYEAEFHAMLDELAPRWKDVLDVFREAVTMQITRGLTFQALAFGIATAAIGVVALKIMPVPYESQATTSMRTAYLTQPVAEEMKTLIDRVLSKRNMVQVMETFNLYPELRTRRQSEKALERIRGSIRISNLPSSSHLVLTSITFRYSDPDVATRVNRQLVTFFIDESIRLHQAEENLRGWEAVEAEQLYMAVWGRPYRAMQVTRMPQAELVSAASEGRRPGMPSPALLTGVALAEGSQLGLILALLRRRELHAKGDPRV